MRETKQVIAAIVLIGCAFASWGCTAAGLFDSGSSIDQLLGGAALSINGSATNAGDSDTLSGTVSGDGQYQLFPFSAVGASESWRVEVAGRGSSNSQFMVALFDRDMNMLARSPSIKALPLNHVFRRATTGAYIGVAPSYGSAGGDFNLHLYRATDSIPTPNPQVAYLNFRGGSGIKVHIRAPMDITPFRALDLNSAYLGDEGIIKSVITETVRADYAPYNVIVYSSDEGAPPSGEYSTLYFGGEDPTLLGLADNVDQYNQDLSQNAVIFISTFAPFSTMELTAEEMGGMIGNVASHELGHLLGLYHTANPDDIMDTTGSAWDLAETQSFLTAKLEPTVFPVGNQDSPMILSDSVGRKSSESVLDLPSVPAKNEFRAALRRLIHQELRWSCGNCADQ